MNRLYRSSEDRQIAGVCGGIGEYYKVDPTIIRVIAVVATALTGFVPGIIAYILLIAIIPVADNSQE